MPQPRPLSSVRLGAYDQPPASSDSRVSSPPSAPPRGPSQVFPRLRSRRERNRRNRYPEPHYYPAEQAPYGVTDRDMNFQPRPLAGRRRQRSPSETDNTDDRSTLEDLPRLREFKRRRLESEPARIPPIKYGHYGQVAPGKLQMDLLSCDGGESVDPRKPNSSLGPRNVLRHDRSVYCSERPYCNIILTHADDTPFSLEKLHIIGPEGGFTAPVKEGMVFVAMHMHEICRYITPTSWAVRQDSEAPPPRRRNRSRHASQERLSLADALRDPEISAAFDEREANYGRAADDHHDLAEGDQRSSPGPPRYPIYQPSDPEFQRDTLLSSASSRRVVNEDSQGRLFTMTSDDDLGPEDSSSQDVIDYRLHRLRLMGRHRRTEDSPMNRERERDYDGWNDLSSLYRRSSETRRQPPIIPPIVSDRATNSSLARLDTMMARSRMHDDENDEDDLASPSEDEAEDWAEGELVPPREIPGRSAPSSPPPWAMLDPQYRQHLRRPYPPNHPSHRPVQPSNHHADTGHETTRTGPGDEHDDPDVTVARFRIGKSKYRVGIHFDPPVSGRFILLRLWANKSNVDVQSIIAVGYGGKRLFPVLEFR